MVRGLLLNSSMVSARKLETKSVSLFTALSVSVCAGFNYTHVARLKSFPQVKRPLSPPSRAP